LEKLIWKTSNVLKNNAILKPIIFISEVFHNLLMSLSFLRHLDKEFSPTRLVVHNSKNQSCQTQTKLGIV
jgi:hypothetical protein